MKMITVFYILNAMFLLLHEIEYAYKKEWKILKFPRKINGFILINVPVILILFYGVIEINKHSQIGFILGVVTGIGGILPFVVHKIFMRKKEHFNLMISSIIIYSNIILGHIIMLLSLKAMIWN